MGYNWKEHLRGMQAKSLYRPLGHAQSRAAEWKSNEILMTYLASPSAATKGRRICRCQLFICLYVLALVELTVLLFFGRFLSSTLSFCSSNWWLMMCGLDACTVCDLPSFVRGCENAFRSFERKPFYGGIYACSRIVLVAFDGRCIDWSARDRVMLEDFACFEVFICVGLRGFRAE